MVRRMVLAIRAFPEVQGVAGVDPAPYSNSNRISSYERDGRDVRYRMANASDELAAVLGIEIVAGRWFQPADDAVGYVPVVISRSLADELWPGQDPLGRLFSNDPRPDGPPSPPRRVVGVHSGFRQDGELMWPAHYVFARQSLQNVRPPRLRNLILKVAPGTTAAVEEKIVRTLNALAPGWSFKVSSQAEMREDKNRIALAPLVAVAVVAAFLMLMVFLGLSGVLWQAVTQRTREIGLRRAKGASAAAVQGQLLAEIGLLTSVGVGLGLLLLAQLPWLDLVGGVSRGVYLASLATTAAAIYVLTLACGLYPGRLAAKLSPAEALHYE
jgi:putative ABC transport system permease protein